MLWYIAIGAAAWLASVIAVVAFFKGSHRYR